MELDSDSLLTRLHVFFMRMLKKVRHFRFDKEVMTFLVFLLVSAVLWVVQISKEVIQTDVQFKLVVKNIPENVIITSNIPHSIDVTISDKGARLAEYFLSVPNRVVEVDFSEYDTGGSSFSVENSVLKRLVSGSMNNSIRIVSISPSNLEFYYSKGERKRVPVKFAGKIAPAPQYELCNVFLEPDSVDVYAPSSMLDTIRAVYTDASVFENVEDTTVSRIALAGIKGAKFIPDSVEINIYSDLFSDKTLQVPIYAENIPDNKILRTFPQSASVTFRVVSSMFNKIKPRDFLLVVDYNSIKEGDTSCRLILRSQPPGVSYVRIVPQDVEYIIEQTMDN